MTIFTFRRILAPPAQPDTLAQYQSYIGSYVALVLVQSVRLGWRRQNPPKREYGHNSTKRPIQNFSETDLGSPRRDLSIEPIKMEFGWTRVPLEFLTWSVDQTVRFTVYIVNFLYPQKQRARAYMTALRPTLTARRKRKRNVYLFSFSSKHRP